MTTPDQDLLRTIFRNSFWSIFSSVSGPVLSFLFGGLTIRYVGIEAAGFSLAVGAVMGIAGRFGTLGIGDAIVPAMAAALGVGDRPRVRRLWGTLLAAALAYSGIAAALLVTCAGAIVAWTRTTVPSEVAIRFIMITAISTISGAIAGCMTVALTAASRQDLVTKISFPLSFLSGVVGCVLVPLFPSLVTVALVGCCTSLISLPVWFYLARSSVPETTRPVFSLVEVPALARYGAWISLTRLLGAMTGGIDELVITGTLGAAAVPPWSICKRLAATIHTFLAQHTEHLIPTLGSIRDRSRQTFDSINSGMHWYVVLIAATGYTFITWAGPAIIAAAAGAKVAILCEIPLFAYGLAGIFWALNIIPVISAMALSDARPAFVIALGVNTAQLLAVVLLARNMGTPAVYIAPVVAIPVLIASLGATGARLFDPGLIWLRVRPVFIPAVLGIIGILAAWATPAGFTIVERMGVGAVLAAAIPPITIAIERLLGVNAQAHGQLFRVIRHAIGLLENALRTIRVCGLRGSADRREVVP